MFLRLTCLVMVYAATVLADILAKEWGYVDSAEVQERKNRARLTREVKQEIDAALHRLLYEQNYGGRGLSVVEGCIIGRRLFTGKPYIKELVREELLCWDAMTQVYLPDCLFLAENGKLYTGQYGHLPVILPEYVFEDTMFGDYFEVDLDSDELDLGNLLDNLKELGT